MEIRSAARRPFLRLAVATALASLGFGAASAGASAPAPEERIIGGSATTIQQWPWQAALLDGGFQICGGSLVAPTVVITAAHCLYDEGADRFPTALGDYRVVTGRTRLSSNEGQVAGVKRIHYPTANGQPRYDPSTAAWDAVILELDSSSVSQTIRLAGADEAALWAAGRDAYVTGWGSTNPNGGGYPDALHVAKVTMVSDAACRNDWGNGFFANLMVCAGDGSSPQRDTCDGDSGGPLVVPDGSGGYRLVGDTSYGAQVCGSGGVYGRIAADPMRSSLRQIALSISGVDIVGSGEAPAPPPPPPPDPPPDPGGLTLVAAERAANRYARRACRRVGSCRSYYAVCATRGVGFRCRAYNFDRFRGRRYTYTRRLRVKPRADGSARVRPRGRWKRRRGW